MTKLLNQNSPIPKSILVVDDDEAVLKAVMHYLKRFWPNYGVMGVRNSRTAWRLLERRSFDLLITDYDMPGMNGLNLAWLARQCLSDLPIILMSGSTLSDLQTEIEASNISFLMKPFSPVQFEAKVKALGL